MFTATTADPYISPMHRAALPPMLLMMKKSEKTGAYYFEETIVPMDSVQEFIAKK